jgi:hypothetical protein
MQRRSGEHSIDLRLEHRIHPRRVAQVSVHNPHAVIIDEGRRSDGEQNRINIHNDRACRREPVEQPAGDRASATREVKHSWCCARDRTNDVEQRADSQLPIGHVVLFETVPRSLPRLGPASVRNECHKTMLGPRISQQCRVLPARPSSMLTSSSRCLAMFRSRSNDSLAWLCTRG